MSATCSKEFDLKVKPNIFVNWVWALTTNPHTGSATATGLGRAFSVSVASAVIVGSTPTANAYANMTYVNGGPAIPCNLSVTATGVPYVSPSPNTYFGLNVDGIVVFNEPALNVAPWDGLNLTGNYPFSILPGSHLYQFWAACLTVGGALPPPGSQSISGDFSVL